MHCVRPLVISLIASLVCGAASAGEVVGRISLAFEGAHIADLGPTVVFLEGGDASAASGRGVVMRQRDARFDPEFLVVPVGQPVRMPNDDTIFHNVFSFSPPNAFDLGTYPAGESRSVVFRHAGLVKVYCSIHESMSATILVAPSPWFARVGVDGQYRIRGVPAGRYKLTAWNERLPRQTRALELGPDGALRADLSLGAEAGARAELAPGAADESRADVPAGPRP